MIIKNMNTMFLVFIILLLCPIFAVNESFEIIRCAAANNAAKNTGTCIPTSG